MTTKQQRNEAGTGQIINRKFALIHADRSLSPACAGPPERHTKTVDMIETDARLQQAIEQIENLYHGLDGLRRDILPKNPRNFALFAEGPLDEIRKLQTEINDYISRLEQVGTA